MEAITNGAEDFLIDSLSFKLPPGTSYVEDRKISQFMATGSNIYKPTEGVRLVRFQLSGDDSNWLDPKSVVFQFTITNTGGAGKLLRPLGQPHLFFKRLRVLGGNGSSVIEDIQDFGRYMELMTSLQNESVKDNADMIGFGGRWDSSTVLNTTDTLYAQAITEDNINGYVQRLLPTIDNGDSKTVAFRPLCGLFNQSKYIPLKWCPLVLEFELGDVNDAIVAPADYAAPYDDYTIANTSNVFELTNCKLIVEIIKIDSQLNNSYIEHLLSGKSLSLEYSTYISQQSAISGNNLAIQIIRAVSRLQRCFITFYKNNDANPFSKPSINFYHPMSLSTNKPRYDKRYELEFQLQLGSKLIPEYSCNSISECFYHLRKSLNLPDHHQHSIGIRYKNYYKDKFVFALSFEKVPDADWSGVSTKAGQLLLVKCKATDGNTLSNIANIMYIVLESQQVLEIRDIGTTIFD